MMCNKRKRVKGLYMNYIVKLGSLVCSETMKIAANQGYNNKKWGALIKITYPFLNLLCEESWDMSS